MLNCAFEELFVLLNQTAFEGFQMSYAVGLNHFFIRKVRTGTRNVRLFINSVVTELISTSFVFWNWIKVQCPTLVSNGTRCTSSSVGWKQTRNWPSNIHRERMRYQCRWKSEQVVMVLEMEMKRPSTWVTCFIRISWSRNTSSTSCKWCLLLFHYVATWRK